MKNREEIGEKIESMSKDELIDFFINSEKAEQELNWYKEQLTILNKLRFSSKSEKIIAGQLNLFNEIEEVFDHPEKEENKKPRKKKMKEANFSKLPTKIIEHKLEDSHCEICGDEMKELAPQVIDILKYKPARYTVERHIVHQYICEGCTDENLEAEIVSAPGAPKKLISGSVASPSVVAGIVFNKYVSGTPLYRQEQQLKRDKVEISRANMSNWLMKCGEKLKPLYNQMLADIRTLSHVHMDETSTLVLEDKKEREKSYMWMISSGKWEEKQMVIYSYHNSREHAYAQELLGKDYAGGVHCDGYEAYHKLGANTEVYGCMAHLRRYFVEAMEANQLHKKAKTLKDEELKSFCEAHPSYGNIVRILAYIQYFFTREKKYVNDNLKPEEIRKKRQEEQLEKIGELFAYIERHENEYTIKSKMGKAITYAMNQKKYVSNYINDGFTEISNNRGERAIKPFVIGRKNWLFSKTKSGAEMSSIYFSLVESAKMNTLNIHEYLEYVLEQIQNEESPQYDKLLPYSPQLPDSLRVK